MLSKISFKIDCMKSVFLDPRKGFDLTEENIQVRYDPLTGKTGHFSHVGAINAQKLDLEKYRDPLVKGYCPFCGERKTQATPKFAESLISKGRMTQGESLLVPNLYPYDIYSAVNIMTDDHVVPLDEFDNKRLIDSFSIGIGFLKKVKSKDPSIPFHLMAWNYMPPSGGGLVHPHQQYFATKYPGNQFMDELIASKNFFEQRRVDYWSELIQEERKRGERYIGQLGDSYWLTSFISLGILGEILCIFPNVFYIEQFTDQNIDELVSGLRIIFEYYLKKNIYSFNASLFFGPGEQEYFPAHFRIVPRTFLNTRDYAPDLNFFQAIMQEPVSVVMPEDLCREIKGYFRV